MKILLLFYLLAVGVRSSYDGVSVIRIIDGDSYKITAPFLPAPLVQSLTLRVAGIDTPEAGWRAKCARESDMATQALHVVKNWLELAEYSVLLYKWDKYGGRVLGNIVRNCMNGSTSISEHLLRHGYAVRYHGRGQRHDWCKHTDLTELHNNMICFAARCQQEIIGG